MLQGMPPPLMPPSLPFDPNRVVGLIWGLGALVVGAAMLKWVFRSPIGEAIAEGIRARRRRRWGGARCRERSPPRMPSASARWKSRSHAAPGPGRRAGGAVSFRRAGPGRGAVGGARHGPVRGHHPEGDPGGLFPALHADPVEHQRP